MHRKRVTSELHDSYFRLMTIKHSISKIQWVIVWALNYYIIELRWVPKQLPADFQTVETRCGREATPDRGGPRQSPDGVDPNIRRTRKTQRDGHNSGIKIWSLCSVSAPSHMQTLNNPFESCNKVRGEYFSKEVFLRRLFLRLPSCVLYSCVCLWYCVVVMLNERVNNYITKERFVIPKSFKKRRYFILFFIFLLGRFQIRLFSHERGKSNFD